MGFVYTVTYDSESCGELVLDGSETCDLTKMVCSFDHCPEEGKCYVCHSMDIFHAICNDCDGCLACGSCTCDDEYNHRYCVICPVCEECEDCNECSCELVNND